jgi:hypothetical protein
LASYNNLCTGSRIRAKATLHSLSLPQFYVKYVQKEESSKVQKKEVGKENSGKDTNTNTNTNNLLPPFLIRYNKVYLIITIINMITQLCEFLSFQKR